MLIFIGYYYGSLIHTLGEELLYLIIFFLNEVIK